MTALDSHTNPGGVPWSSGRTTRDVALDLIAGAADILRSPHTTDGHEAAELLRDAVFILTEEAS